LFGEHSVSWRLVSRWTVLLGGPAAVLLQVAHPSVGAGVSQHSSYAEDALGRLERTLSAMLAISFGSPERREAVLAELRSLHQPVVGTRDDGVPYRALDPELQLWVWATLGYVALEVERRYVHRLTHDDRKQYYLESTELARCFRVPERLIPADLEAFERYVADTIAGLEVTADALETKDGIMRPRLGPIPPGLFAPAEWVTVDLLGPELASAFGFAPLTSAQRRLVRTSKGVGRQLLPRLPEPLLSNPLNKRSIA